MRNGGGPFCPHTWQRLKSHNEVVDKPGGGLGSRMLSSKPSGTNAERLPVVATSVPSERQGAVSQDARDQGLQHMSSRGCCRVRSCTCPVPRERRNRRWSALARRNPEKAGFRQRHLRGQWQAPSGVEVSLLQPLTFECLGSLPKAGSGKTPDQGLFSVLIVSLLGRAGLLDPQADLQLAEQIDELRVGEVEVFGIG
jgi:hypothetical protein